MAKNNWKTIETGNMSIDGAIKHRTSYFTFDRLLIAFCVQLMG